MKDPLGTESSRRELRALAAASGLGISVVAGLLICIGGGVLLDKWLGTSPILTLVGIVLGLAVAGYFFYELATLSLPKKGLTRPKNHGGIHRSSDRDEYSDESPDE